MNEYLLPEVTESFRVLVPQCLEAIGRTQTEKYNTPACGVAREHQRNIQERMEAILMETLKVRNSKAHLTYCLRNGEVVEISPPRMDHAKMYTRGRGSVIVAYQPYREEKNELRDTAFRMECEEWAVEEGWLWAESRDWSWYWPGRTTLVYMERKPVMDKQAA